MEYSSAMKGMKFWSHYNVDDSWKFVYFEIVTFMLREFHLVCNFFFFFWRKERKTSEAKVGALHVTPTESSSHDSQGHIWGYDYL